MLDMQCGVTSAFQFPASSMNRLSDSSSSSTENSPSPLTLTPSPTMRFELATSQTAYARLRHQPYINIIEQPMKRGFRFRYDSEKGKHGGLQGDNSVPNRKSYPKIKIENCEHWQGQVRLEVSLYSSNTDPPRPHVHKLLGKNNLCTSGNYVVEFGAEQNWEHIIHGLGILHVPKKEVANILKQRKLAEMIGPFGSHSNSQISNQNYASQDLREVEDAAEKEAKELALDRVRLHFKASLLNENGEEVKLLAPVNSEPIYDAKAPGAGTLKICRMDKNTSPCNGGEEIFLLCEKVQREDIQIRFYEEDEHGDVVWEGFGEFAQHDVHKQYAIVFRTPPYRHHDIEEEKKVFIQLCRIKDKVQSAPKTFTYSPDYERIELHKKETKDPIFHTPAVTNQLAATMPSVGWPYSNRVSAANCGDLIQQFNSAIDGRNSHPAKLNAKAPQKKDLEMVGDLTERIEEVCIAEDASGKTKSTGGTEYLFGVVDQLLKTMTKYTISGDVSYRRLVERELSKSWNERGDRLLHCTVASSRVDILTKLLPILDCLAPSSFINDTNNIHQTALHVAVDSGQNPEIILLLLHHMADVVAADTRGNTPIHVAVENGDSSSLRALLKAAPHILQEAVAQENLEGDSALELAVRGGHAECIKLMKKFAHSKKVMRRPLPDKVF